MNKPVLAVAGAVAIALVATPWMFGALAQQRIDAGIARLDAENDIDAAVVDYARGFTTSTATIELTTPTGAVDDAPVPPEMRALLEQLSAQPVRLLVTMRHGPVLLGDGPLLGIAASTIRLDPALPRYREFLDAAGIEYLFEIRTVTGFDGRSEFVADMPAFALREGADDITFSGADATGSYDIASRRLIVSGQADELRIASDATTFAAEALTFDSDSTWQTQLLRVGYAAASVGRISADSPVETFGIDNVAVRFDVALDDGGERATMLSEYAFDRLSDGAELNLEDFAVTAVARRVDIDALTAYAEAMQSAALQNDAAAPLALDAEDALYDLLAASPEIEIAPVRFEWNGEPLDATVRVGVTADVLPPRTSFTLLALIFQGVVAVDATLAVSSALATALASRAIAFQIRRAAAQDGQFMTDDQVQTIANAQASIALATLAAQGMLTSTADGFATTARFADGALTVNGNSVPLGLR